MENLLNSRLSRDASPSKLENLSPNKFGKAAFASLTFTPSKLVDNVLYKEVTTLKKIEEESSKVRESETLNSVLKDRLSQIIEERDGIEEALTKQILMYKKMLNENEIKHEQRIKDIQKSFNEEMQRLISAKEEEAKYAQSQKELLEGRIQELEAEVADLKDKLDHGGNTFDQLTRQHEKLEIHFKNTCEKLEQTEAKLKEEGDKAKAAYQQLSRKLYNTEVDFKGKIDKLQLEQEREKENMERHHRSELQKVQNRRVQEALTKNQELKDLASTFEAEANRLKDIINSKERSIEHLNQALNAEKQKILEMTKSYTTQISNLVHEKNRYREEIDAINLNLTITKEDANKAEASAQRTIKNLQSVVAKLKDDLQLSHVNYLREKDRNAFVVDDLHREIVALKSENERAGVITAENGMLCKQIRNLKDLLLQSSLQMEKCKQEFIRIGREKDHLAVKVRQLGYENETLHRIKYEKEQEAKGWRDSYYMSRR